MTEAADYTETTGLSDLYRFLADLVVSGRATSFSELLDAAKPVPLDKRTAGVFVEAFALLKKIHWGFFRDIDPDAYPKVWKQVVIPHPRLKACGDLKRNLTISDVFVGILDLHGYTRFCEKNKNNLSMLQMLDDVIQDDVVRIARTHDVVLQRRNGDEMVLVAAGAADILAATMVIIGYFSKKRQISVRDPDERRSGYKIILDDMHVSAGIAGGRKFTPFIITRDGDLSGGVVNTAARLQSRANELSSDRSRILVTKTVYTKFEAETAQALPESLRDKRLRFFDSGWIQFKGISVAVHEVVHDDADRYKLLFEQDIQELYKAAEKGAWKDGIFAAATQLLARIFKTMPPFTTAARFGDPPKGNSDLVFLALQAGDLFRLKQDYLGAIAELERIIGYAREIPRFDRLCLEYAETVLASYAELRDAFASRLKAKLDEKAPLALPIKYKRVYEECKKAVHLQKVLQDEVAKSLTPLDLSLLWSSAVDETRGNAPLEIRSGKK